MRQQYFRLSTKKCDDGGGGVKNYQKLPGVIYRRSHICVVSSGSQRLEVVEPQNRFKHNLAIHLDLNSTIMVL